MKASWLILVLAVSVGGLGAPACGGKSSAGSTRNGAGGEGGAGGQGGSGAGPSSHLSECEALCERTEDADCTSDAGSCLMVCATVTGYPACQSQIETWLTCAEDSSIECDPSGVPTFTDCENELMLVSACAVTTPPPKAVAESCDDFCSKLEAEGCNVDSQLGGCSQTCGITGNVVAACEDAFVAATQCQIDADVTCDETGQPVMTGCESELSVYAGCVLMEVGLGTQTSTAAAGGASAVN